MKLLNKKQEDKVHNVIQFNKTIVRVLSNRSVPESLSTRVFLSHEPIVAILIRIFMMN